MGAEEKQVVVKLFEAFSKGDIQGIGRMLADDVDWCVTGDPNKMPWAGRFHGADAVLELMSSNAGATEDLKIEVKWIVSEDDKVILLINESATVAQTGRFYDVDSVHIYTVKDGKISKFENHFNPIPLLEATFGDIRYVEPHKRDHRVIKEEWTFFEGEAYHHFETFSYEYDENGRRIRGELNNPARDVKYIMSYEYDNDGKATGETWVNSANDRDIYTITFEYDEDNARIVGGQAVGQNAWEFTYEYDKYGKKTRMTNEFANGFSWVFTYHYNEEGRCVLGQGIASYGRRCTITYQYEDAEL